MPRARIAIPFGAFVLLSGCPASSSKSATDAGALLTSSPPAAARLGVKVPLPDGWTARVGADQSFRAGPGERIVLRIDQEADDGKALPTAAALEKTLKDSLGSEARLRAEETQEGTDSVVTRFALQFPSDGGVRILPVALGAKRLGEDLFLCSTEPGSTEEEVRKAAQACQSLIRAKTITAP